MDNNSCQGIELERLIYLFNNYLNNDKDFYDVIDIRLLFRIRGYFAVNAHPNCR